MATAVAAEGLVGATWALVTPDGVITGAAGFKDLAQRTPMRADNRVQVGSITKTLTATGVLRLVTLGKVTLDAPLNTYLPDLPIRNPWERTAPLRVRHLLDHTNGLGDAHLWQVFTTRGDPDAPLRAGLLRDGQSLDVRHPPGARFSYSNTGYLLLGMLIERVTGERYETWLDRELLAPLQMEHSTFAFVSQVGPRGDTSMAMGHFDGQTPQASYAIPVRPAAQFATTAADMARFAQFLMSDGVVNGTVLVDSMLLRAMARPTTTDAARDGLSAGYALGMLRRERWGITGNCHLGNLGTFRALLCMYPESQRAFFVSYNTDPEGASFDRVDSLLAMALQVPPTAPVTLAAMSITPGDWDGWYAVRPNRFPQFAYLDELAALTHIRWADSTLTLQPLQGTTRVLRPLGGALFRLEGRRAATHVLGTTPEGAVFVTDGTRTFERVSMSSVMLRWLSAGVGLLGLVYLLTIGAVRVARAWRQGALRDEPLRWAFFGVLITTLVPLLLLTQPALAIGDPTPAAWVLAGATVLLPLMMLASLIDGRRRRAATRPLRLDDIMLLAALQWCAVLASWGLVPLVLWR